MPAAIGPRFVLEAGFLILLAVVVGLADLSPALIILVMTVGWLLVALIEYFAWRQSVGFPAMRRFATAEAAPAASPRLREEVVEDVGTATATSVSGSTTAGLHRPRKRRSSCPLRPTRLTRRRVSPRPRAGLRLPPRAGDLPPPGAAPTSAAPALDHLRPARAARG